MLNKKLDPTFKALGIEVTHSASRLAMPDSHSQVYDVLESLIVSRTLRADYRAAERVARQAPHRFSALQRARTAIVRGEVEEAHEALIEAEVTGEMSAEILLDRARVAGGLEGNWEAAISFSSTGLLLEPAAITRLALHQVRANALLELREYKLFDREWERAESMIALFPKAPVAFYLEILRAKRDWLESTPAIGHELWSELFEGKMSNLDEALTALRLRAWGRAKQKDPGAWRDSWAAYHVAEALGDELYQALSLLELRAALGKELPNHLKKKITVACSRHLRVQKLVQAVDTGEAICLTSEVLLQFPRAQLSKSDIQALRVEPELIVSASAQFKISLPSKTAMKLSTSAKTRQLLRALSATAQITKGELLRQAWGIASYHKLNHDPLIRNALVRARRETGLRLDTREGDVVTDPLWMVD